MCEQDLDSFLINGKAGDVDKIITLPTNHADIVMNEYRVREGFSTACYRGYSSCWAISDGKLFLTKISGNFHLRGRHPILADWFSGTLIIHKGNQYRDKGRISRKKDYANFTRNRLTYLVIENGLVVYDASQCQYTEQGQNVKIALTDKKRFLRNYYKKNIYDDKYDYEDEEEYVKRVSQSGTLLKYHQYQGNYMFHLGILIIPFILGGIFSYILAIQ